MYGQAGGCYSVDALGFHTSFSLISEVARNGGQGYGYTDSNLHFWEQMLVTSSQRRAGPDSPLRPEQRESERSLDQVFLRTAFKSSFFVLLALQSPLDGTFWQSV